MTGRIKENSFYEIEASFFDSEGAAALPASIRYQIQCLTSGKLVRDWTSVTIGTTVSIIVTDEENDIQNDRNNREKKQIVVQATNADGLKTTNTLEWIVDNLKSVR